VQHLLTMGFGPFFVQQLDPEEFPNPRVGRVVFISHSNLRLALPDGSEVAAMLAPALQDRTHPVVVGDWVTWRPGDPYLAVRRFERVRSLQATCRRLLERALAARLVPLGLALAADVAASHLVSAGAGWDLVDPGALAQVGGLLAGWAVALPFTAPQPRWRARVHGAHHPARHSGPHRRGAPARHAARAASLRGGGAGAGGGGGGGAGGAGGAGGGGAGGA
jgi:uncharacterized membrane protein YgcG